MKKHEITTSKGEFVVVDGMGDFAYKGVYCPTCDEDMPMDGAVHCYVCGSSTAYGEFHDDDIPFDDDGYEKDRRIVWRRICKLSEATDEDAKCVVDENERGYFYYVKHIDNDGSNTTTSSLESLHSLLTSKGIDINNGNLYLFEKVL